MARESALLRKGRKKATLLSIDVSAVLAGDLVGAFYAVDALNLAEYTLHEAAHFLGLGRRLDQFEAGFDVTGWITDTFSVMPPLSADALEIDAAFISHLAGVRLKLWSDPAPIMESAGKNLTQIVRRKEMQALLEQLFQEAPSRTHQTLADELVRWWRQR